MDVYNPWPFWLNYMRGSIVLALVLPMSDSVRRGATLSDSEGSERGTTIWKRPSSDVPDPSDAVPHRKKIVRRKPAAAHGLAPEEGEECGDDPQKKPAAPKEGEEGSDDPQKKPAAALEEGKECGDDGNKAPKIWKRDKDGRWNTSDGTAPYKIVPYWSKKKLLQCGSTRT